MDAGNMLEVRAAPQRVYEHNNQPYFPDPKSRVWRDGTVCSLLPLREKGWG